MHLPMAEKHIWLGHVMANNAEMNPTVKLPTTSYTSRSCLLRSEDVPMTATTMAKIPATIISIQLPPNQKAQALAAATPRAINILVNV